MTTPALLLAEASERLARAADLERARRRPQRARRRQYRGAARTGAALWRPGLKRFVRDLEPRLARWRGLHEGRVDADGDAIEIITIHSAKGLEWPVVIPINTATLLRSREAFVHRRYDDTLHWVIGDVVPPELRVALETMTRACSANANGSGTSPVRGRGIS